MRDRDTPGAACGLGRDSYAQQPPTVLTTVLQRGVPRLAVPTGFLCLCRDVEGAVPHPAPPPKPPRKPHTAWQVMHGADHDMQWLKRDYDIQAALIMPHHQPSPCPPAAWRCATCLIRDKPCGCWGMSDTPWLTYWKSTSGWWWTKPASSVPTGENGPCPRPPDPAPFPLPHSR